MLVKAIAVGYYAHGDNPVDHELKFPAEYSHKRNAGQPFVLHKPKDFSPTWMEIVEATDEERAEVEAIVLARKDKFKIAKDHTITMNAFGAPPAAPGVKVKDSPVDQLAKRHEAAAKKRKNQKSKPVEAKDEEDI